MASNMSNKILDIILILLFIGIIFFGVIAGINTIHTNSIVRHNIASLTIDTNNTDYELIEKINEKINSINYTKNYILDSNSISFLFQLLSVLIIGIGIYLLNIVNRKIGKLKKIEKEILELHSITKIYNILNLKLERLYMLSMLLEYNNQERKVTNFFKMQFEIEAINEIIKNELDEEIKPTDRSILIDVLCDVIYNVESIDLNAVYFKDIHHSLLKLLNKLRGV
jgi:hypothetical protein